MTTPDWVGPVAAREFEGAAGWAKSELLAWVEQLPGLSDEDFYRAARSAIYDSALVNRFRGNWEHIHFKATVCFKESQRRKAAAGHDEDCRGPSLYSKAHAELMRDHSYQPTPAGECRCPALRGKP